MKQRILYEIINNT